MSMSKSERATLRKELLKLNVPGEAVEGDWKLAFLRMGKRENRITSAEFNWARLMVSLVFANVFHKAVKIVGYSISVPWDDEDVEVDDPEATPLGALNRCVLEEGVLPPNESFDGVLYARLAGPIPVHLRKLGSLPVTVHVHMDDESVEDYRTSLSVEFKPTVVSLSRRKGGGLFDAQGSESLVSMLQSSDAPQAPEQMLNKSLSAEPEKNIGHSSKL